MPKPTDIRICCASATTERINYRTPIKFGGRVVSEVVQLHVEVEVETAGGRRAIGFGSMPMGNVWAWPAQCATSDQTLAAMIELGQRLVSAADRSRLAGHPLDITRSLSVNHTAMAKDVITSLGIPEPMPPLAQLVAASPLEAAIHDSFGRAHEKSSYNLLGPEWVSADLAHYLSRDFRGEFLDQYTTRDPKTRMPLYHLVGALDPLTSADIHKPVGDGLPETLGEWIVADGLSHLKIKLAGDDLQWDVERVLAVEMVACECQSARGCTDWCYSLDFNEKCGNVEYILEFLAKIQELSPAAFRRVQYIEQPTHRDLRAHPENHMHRAAEIKPVVIDESLIDFESLLLCRELGYTGVALKACKGQTEALLMGAAAQKYGMFLCVQDLTCPGRSFLHSASIAARLPTIVAIEGNGRQYCPAGNRGWAERYPSMFDVTDGTIGTSILNGPGLGYS